MTPAFGCTMKSGVRPLAGSPNLLVSALRSITAPPLSAQTSGRVAGTVLLVGSTAGQAVAAVSKPLTAARWDWSFNQTKATSSSVTCPLPTLLPVIGSLPPPT